VSWEAATPPARVCVPKQTPGTTGRCDQLACLPVYERQWDNFLVSDALSCGLIARAGRTSASTWDALGATYGRRPAVSFMSWSSPAQLTVYLCHRHFTQNDTKTNRTKQQINKKETKKGID